MQPPTPTRYYVMSNVRPANCPFCGNDRVLEVTRFHAEGARVLAFCAGALGCHAWWDAAGSDPRPLSAGCAPAGSAERRPDGGGTRGRSARRAAGAPARTASVR